MFKFDNIIHVVQALQQESVPIRWSMIVDCNFLNLFICTETVVKGIFILCAELLSHSIRKCEDVMGIDVHGVEVVIS